MAVDRLRMAGDLSQEDDLVFLRECVAHLVRVVDLLLSRQVNIAFVAAGFSSLDLAAKEACDVWGWPRVAEVKNLARQRMGDMPRLYPEILE